MARESIDIREPRPCRHAICCEVPVSCETSSVACRFAQQLTSRDECISVIAYLVRVHDNLEDRLHIGVRLPTKAAMEAWYAK